MSHTPKDESWQDRFDAKLWRGEFDIDYHEVDGELIKAFIAKELERQRAELVKAVEGLKMKHDRLHGSIDCQGCALENTVALIRGESNND